MKSQTILSSLRPIAVIFGLPSATQYLSKTKKPGAITGPDQRLFIFSFRKLTSMVASSVCRFSGGRQVHLGRRKMEIEEPGAYEFGFNSQEVPSKLASKSKTCKCTKVTIRLAGNDNSRME